MRSVPLHGRIRQAMRSPVRRALATAGVIALSSVGVVALATQANAAAGCRVTYSAPNPWPGGFTANITITNLGDPITNGWNLGFDFPAAGQAVQYGWSATWTQSGQHVNAASLDWNKSLATNASTSIGFNGAWTTSNPNPTTFTLNGVVCTGQVGGSSSPSASASASASPSASRSASASPSASRSASASPSASVSTSPPPVGQRVNNPYEGATGYVNPMWKARAQAEPGGSRVANTATAVWFDRISSLYGNGSPTTGTMGLEAHLNEAVAQDAANGSTALVFQMVVYNLPGRDCSALASNGELGVDELPRYKAEYIDPMAEILGRAAYRNLRIVAVIEIDSLPNLVTNLNIAKCATMNSNGGYVNGVGYALNKLGDVPNVYNYIDAAHHGWIGWSSNFGPTAQKLYEASNASGATPADVHGFVTNTANTSALQEPYINLQGTVNGAQIRSSKWVDWNDYNDELSFAQAFRNRLVSQGFNSNIGMLIDTSRNGWGTCVQGPCQPLTVRPTASSTSTVLETYINESRIDHRIHKGNWCNQAGAGLGERPRANPASGIDAYVWVKPPGESDGSSTLIPNDEGKGFDRMCDPTYTGNSLNGNNMSGALPNAPLSGHWFSAQFQQLMANAYPPL